MDSYFFIQSEDLDVGEHDRNSTLNKEMTQRGESVIQTLPSVSKDSCSDQIQETIENFTEIGVP